MNAPLNRTPYGHATRPKRKRSLLWLLFKITLVPGIVVGLLALAAVPLAFG
jgi:hypothetical protein